MGNANTPNYPSALGPYTIVEPLGRGGMGVVYRARHRDTGVEVALKTLNVPHARLLSCIRREIATLARLRHPGIVRILDEGTSDGIPWYSMELIAGHTFRKRFMAPPSGDVGLSAGTTKLAQSDSESSQTGWFDGPTDSLSLWTDNLSEAPPPTPHATQANTPDASPFDLASVQEALRSIHQLCAALAFLHGEGIVHGDLKPSNILMRADGTPVLVDFGLATMFSGMEGREILEERGSLMGTVDYMAPETHRRALIDARADLYALGCLLHELFAGSPPFTHPTLAQKIQAHMHDDPVPLSRLVRGLPKDLETLVLQLLAKSPAARLGHAEHVSQRLAAFAPPPAPPLLRPRAYLYRPKMTGRARPIKALLRHLEPMRGGLVCLEGESGVGKTRLLMEFARQSRQFGADALSGGCQPTDPEAPTHAQPALAALRGPLQTLVDRCLERGEHEATRIFGQDGDVLRVYEPQIARLPGVGLNPPQGAIPANAMRRLVFCALERVFATQARQRPTLLVLDDLQWADDLTLGFIEHLLETRPWDTVPLLVVVAWRREETSPRLDALLHDPQTTPVALDRLGAEAVGALVADMLAIEQAPARFVAYLEHQSEGNPLFITEYLRAAVDEQLLDRDHEGKWIVREQANALQDIESLPLPTSLRDLMWRRLTVLSDEAIRAAQWASVLGRTFHIDLLSSAPEVTLPIIHELQDRHILEEHDGTRLRFVHDKLREVAYQRISPGPRRLLHLRAAEHLSTTPEEQRDALQAELGHHWLQAEDPARAQACFTKAAQFATSRYDLKEAERLYRQALTLDDGTHEIALRNALGHQVIWVMGDGPRACIELEHALALARRLNDASGEKAALYGLSDIHAATGETTKGHTLLDHSMSLLTPDDTLTRARLLAVRARTYIYEDKPSQAMPLIAQALEQYQHLSMASEALDVKRLKALTLLREGSMVEAEQQCLDVITQAKQLGRVDITSKTLIHLGIIFGLTGRFEQAHANYAQALELLRRIGERQGEVVCLSNMVHLRLQEQHFDAAIPLSHRALALAKQLNNARAVAIISMNLAHAEFARGDMREAERLNDEALSMFRAQNALGYYGHTLFNQASVKRIARQDFEDAQNMAKEAIVILQDENDAYILAAAHIELGHILLARGQNGRSQYDKALSVLADSGLNIENSELSSNLLKLEQALEDFDAGTPLVRGDRLSSLPKGVQKWLTDRSADAE